MGTYQKKFQELKFDEAQPGIVHSSNRDTGPKLNILHRVRAGVRRPREPVPDFALMQAKYELETHNTQFLRTKIALANVVNTGAMDLI